MSDADRERRPSSCATPPARRTELHARLAQAPGATPTGHRRLRSSTVDHKVIGRRYIVTAFFFLFLGGLCAVADAHAARAAGERR